MSLLKRAEIALRRTLLRLLALVINRGRTLPREFDFSTSKILFVRQDRIGDVLVSTPLFESLRATYPNAAIDVLLSTNNYFVLANNPAIRKRWIYRKSPVDAVRLLRAIRRERYDFLVDLMDNPSATSTILAALAGARWNVGLGKENQYVYDVVVPLLSRRETHIVERLAQLLTVFRIDPSKADLRVRYVVSPASRHMAREFLEAAGLLNRPIIGVNISAGGRVRYWGTENFRFLLRHCARRYPEAGILVLYHPSDRERARAIVSDEPRATLAPETRDFDHFAALVESVSLLITPDTSAAHLASAFRIPAVVLYVQSNKELRVWEPYGVPAETLVTDVDELSTIPWEAVTAALDRIARTIEGLQPLSPPNDKVGLMNSNRTADSRS